MSKNKLIGFGNPRAIFKKHQEALILYELRIEESSRLKKMANQFKYDMDQLEGKYRSEVNNELDVTTGKFMYTNAASRADEVASRLRGNVSYQEQRGMLEDTEDQLLQTVGELDVLKRKLRFFEVNA